MAAEEVTEKIMRRFLRIKKKLTRSNVLIPSTTLLIATSLSFVFLEERLSKTKFVGQDQDKVQDAIPTAYMKCTREVGTFGNYRQQIIEFYDQNLSESSLNPGTEDRANHKDQGQIKNNVLDSVKNLISIRVFNTSLVADSVGGRPSPFRSCSSSSPNYTWSLLCQWDYELVKSKVEKAGVESYIMTGPASDFLESLQLSPVTHSVSDLCLEVKKLKCNVLSPPKTNILSDWVNPSSLYEFVMYVRRKIFYIIVLILFCL